MADKNYDSSLYATPLYYCWQNLKKRCDNPNATYYCNYGGRGIGYPTEWVNFSGFLKDMQGSYSDGLTIDRIDNDKDYSLGNCRWVDNVEQSNNRRSNRLFTIKGKTKTFAQWILEYRVKSSTARQRYYVYGWTIENSLSGKRG